MNSRNRSSISLRTTGSSPLVASSSTSSLGWCASAVVSASLARMPFENSLNGFSMGRANRLQYDANDSLSHRLCRWLITAEISFARMPS